MENQEKEIGQFLLGIRISQDGNGNMQTHLFTRNNNALPEIVLTHLRSLPKMLEDDYYPAFRGKTTHVHNGSDE